MLLILCGLWLSWAEEALWRFKLDMGTLVFALLSVGLVLNTMTLWITSSSRARIVILAGVGASLVVLGMSVSTFWVADSDCVSTSTPENIELLLTYNKVRFYGVRRGFSGRFKGVVGSSVHNVESDIDAVAQALPKDFRAYAALVDPAMKSAENQELVLKFFSWQFPEYVPYIVIDDPVRGGVRYLAYEEDSRIRATGIHRVRPWIEELLKGQGNLAWRLRSYRLLVRYALITPHDRDDLADDPYFRLVRGETDVSGSAIQRLPKSLHRLASTRSPPDSRTVSRPTGYDDLNPRWGSARRRVAESGSRPSRSWCV